MLVLVSLRINRYAKIDGCFSYPSSLKLDAKLELDFPVDYKLCVYF